MKKILHLTLAGVAWLAVLAAPLARAWTYQDGDVLLIFRENGSDDVEFDIGSINQFLGHTNGYSAKVTGWSSNLVNNTFGSISGASLIVASTTSSSAWLSSSANVLSVSDVTPSTWHSALYSLIDAVGSRPTNDNETASGTNSYVIQQLGDTSAGQSSLASYDYIVTGGGQSEAYITEFGGNVPFVVEGVAPATLGLWEIQPSTAIPKPEAAYIGTFDIDANGNLYFYVGSLQPTITGIVQHGEVSTVSFTTLDNGSYSLLSTNALGAPISTWPVVNGPLQGNSGIQSLSYTNSGGNTAGFFAVARSP